MRLLAGLLPVLLCGGASQAAGKLNMNRFFGHAANAAAIASMTPEQQAIFNKANRELFTQFTIAGMGNWRAVEGVRDVMFWNNLDALKDMHVNDGFDIREQSMIGRDQYTPSWICAIQDSAELEHEFHAWLAAYQERFPDVASSINIYNEPVGWADDKEGRPCWADLVGGDGATGYDWLIWAAREVRAVMPNRLLTINENRILNDTVRFNKYFKMNSLLKERGLIDEIGLQCHGLENTLPSTLKASLDKLAGIGLPIRITEMTVDIADDSAQAVWYKTRFPVLWEHPAVVGLTHWTLYEPIVWSDRPHSFLIYADGTEKPALTWLRQYLGIGTEMAPAAPSTVTAAPGNHMAILRWARNTERDLRGYYVYRAADSGGPYTKISPLLTQNSYIDSTAENGQTFYYVLKAVDTLAQYSRYSGELRVSPDASISIRVPSKGWSPVPGPIGMGAGWHLHDLNGKRVPDSRPGNGRSAFTAHGIYFLSRDGGARN